MEKQARIDSILRKMRTHLDTYLDEEPLVTDPIEYENKLLSLGDQFSREVLLESRGTMPKSRNQKKSPDETGSS